MIERKVIVSRQTPNDDSSDFKWVLVEIASCHTTEF